MSPVRVLPTRNLPIRNLPGPGGTPLDAIGAVNRLIALPWTDLGQQYAREAEQDIQNDLESKDLSNAGNKGGEIRWSFSLKSQAIHASVDLANPPGLSAAALTGFNLAAPLVGNWSAKLSGELKGKMRVWAADAPPGVPDIFSWGPTLSWGFEVQQFRILAGATLNPSDPSRPVAQSFFIQPHLNVGGSGAIPISVPLGDFQINITPGTITLTRRITNLSMDLDGLGARLTADLKIALKSNRSQISDLEDSLASAFVPTLEVQISLDGDLSFSVPQVGASNAGFGFSTRFVAPSIEPLTNVMWLISQEVPRMWGVDAQGHPLVQGRTLPVSGSIDYATPAEQIEEAIAAHIPYGAVFSMQSSSLVPVRIPPSQPGGAVPVGENRPLLALLTKFYAVEEDSAIWTGHYLAAEAFRYAATDSQEALARVREVLGGIQRLFDVTTDAAVKNGQRVAVQGRGLFARSALPMDSQIRWWEADKSIQNGRCYYEAPEKGWEVVIDGQRRRFATYADVEHFLGTQPVIRRPLVDVRPLGRVWQGLGCGDECDSNKDHPVSRDQYCGVFMGLFAAHQLVADEQVRATAGTLLTEMLSYLIDNNWNVPLPMNDHICTSFLGNFDQQLAFLRIGKTVNPGAFGAIYDQFAAASEVTWLPLWLSLLDPVIQYYKFNLAHAVIWPALLAEDDPALRSSYLVGYTMLRHATAHHRNAYFNLLRILIEPPENRAQTAGSLSGSNPDLVLRDEIKATLAEWLERLGKVRTANGLPSDRVPDPAYQVGLWPQSIQLYTALDESKAYLAKFALPIYGRIGDGMDFVWQRDPFRLGLDTHRNPLSPPTDAEILDHGGDHNREGPGVDYLLAYWMALYLGVLPPS